MKSIYQRKDYTQKTKECFKKIVIFTIAGILSFSFVQPVFQQIQATSPPVINSVSFGASLSTNGGDTVTIDGAALTNIKQVLAGKSKALALTNSGAIYSWGGTTLSPEAFDILGSALEGKPVSRLGTGMDHIIAIDTNGVTYSWGSNLFGELGNGSTTASTKPVAVATNGTPMAGKKIIKVMGGDYFTLALADDGNVYSWGRNNFGQLGNGMLGTNSNVPVAVTKNGTPMAGKTIIDIAAERYSAVALASDGTVYTWGYGTQGQLGNGGTANSGVPVAVTTAGTPMAGKTITKIDKGEDSVMALASDGTLYGWGRNNSGELGTGNRTQANVPVATNMNGTLAGKTVVDIEASGAHHAVITSEGKVYWMGNEYSTTYSILTAKLTPTLLDTTNTPMDGVEIAATSSTYRYGLALSKQGRIYAWGNNNDAVFGNGEIAPSSAKPVAVSTAATPMAGKTIVEVSAGSDFNLVRASDGSLFSWGNNRYGRLGNGSGIDAFTPVQVTTAGTPMAGKTIVAISAGADHALALDNTGEVYAWGGGTSGQLGNNAYSNSLVPVLVTKTGTPMAGKTIVAISAGNWYSLALASDGTVYSWGFGGNRTLGNGSTATSPIATSVDMSGVLSGKSVSRIEAGDSHVLVLTSDGGIYAWGSNYDGQLGTGNTTSVTSPVAVNTTGVLAGKAIIAISARDYSSQAVTSDGNAYAWGTNSDGQLGNGTFTNSSLPVTVDKSGVLAGIALKSVDTGQYGSIALSTDGKVYGWGGGYNAELGNNNLNAPFSLPVATHTAGTPMESKVISQIAMGYWHSIALADDGSVYTWGYDLYGQLGNGANPSMLPPVASNDSLLGTLANAPTITVNGATASNVQVIDNSRITFTSPAKQNGTYSLTLAFTDGRNVTVPNSMVYGTGVADPEPTDPQENETPTTSPGPQGTSGSTTPTTSDTVRTPITQSRDTLALEDSQTSDNPKEEDRAVSNTPSKHLNAEDTPKAEERPQQQSSNGAWGIWLVIVIALIVAVILITYTLHRRHQKNA